MRQHEIVKEHFDRTSNRWEDFYQSERPWRGDKQNYFSRLSHVRTMISDSSGDLLDVGCGPGIVTKALWHPGIRSITGIDFSPEMIERAQKHADLMGLPVKVNFAVGDAEGLEFPDESFDIITALEYADDPLKFLQSLARVAKKGGIIVVTTPNRYSILRIIEEYGWEGSIYLARKSVRWLRSLARGKDDRDPIDNIRHQAYSRHSLEALARSVGLTMDARVHCTVSLNPIESIVPIGGPLTRVLDSFSSQAWIAFFARNLIVRLKKP